MAEGGSNLAEFAPGRNKSVRIFRLFCHAPSTIASILVAPSFSLQALLTQHLQEQVLLILYFTPFEEPLSLIERYCRGHVRAARLPEVDA